MNLATLAIFTQFGRVFPLHPNTKVPLVQWKKRATIDLKIIDGWLVKYPNAGWALVPDRAVIVDVDVKNGSTGPDSIEARGGLEPTFRVRTPSGGTHHYYAPDPEIPFQTRNGWLPGVDIRYGGNGYVVLPYTRTIEGTYTPETDLDGLDTCVSKSRTRLTNSILPSMPSWIKERLVSEPVLNLNSFHSNQLSNNPLCDVPKCDGEWNHIRDRVRYLFFKNQKNRRIWKYKPVNGMADQTQSGYEWQLTVRLMNVGATDEEILTVYRIWCRRHFRKIKQDRFLRKTIPNARLATAEYIERWNASQPKRRKHGTTTNQIIEAIEAGCRLPSEIERRTGLKGSTVRMHLKRLLSAGTVMKDASGYSIPCVCSPSVELKAA